MSPIRVDPIESTPDYQAAMVKVQPELDKLPQGFGTNVYAFWATKKRLLKEEGVDWKTPAEMNPEILFD